MDNFGLDGVPWQDVMEVSIGSPKPYDAEVEYLESQGNQYVDTGVIPDSTTAMDVYGVFKQGSNGARLGVRDNVATNNFAVNNVSSTRIRVDFGTGTGGAYAYGADKH